MTDALLPSTSATAFTLDAGVSREVQKRCEALGRKTIRGVVTTLGFIPVGGLITQLLGGGDAGAWTMCVLLAVFVLPVFVASTVRRWRASSHAKELHPKLDVAWVGPDGLVFFADHGYFVEKRGGWMPYGTRGVVSRSLDTASWDRREGRLVVSSIDGYSVSFRVPSRWTDADTARVQEKLDAFND